MWSRFYTKITSSSFYKILLRYLNSLLGRVEKITPLEVYVVILVVASVVFITRYFQQQSSLRLIKIEVTTQEWINGENQDKYKAPFWLSEQLAAGQTQRSSRGKVLAEIVDIENYEYDDNQAQVYLVISLMANYNEKLQIYSFQGRSLLVGSPIKFEFDGNSVPGQILDDNYPRSGYDQGEFIVTTRLKYLEPWYLEELKPGAIMKNRASGEVVAEMIDFSFSPTKTTKVLNFNSQSVISAGDYQDLTVKLKIKAHKQDGNWFFAGQQRVRLGSSLWIYLDDSMVLSNAEIIHLEYVSQ